MDSSGKPIMMVGTNWIIPHELKDPLMRNIPYLLLNDKDFEPEQSKKITNDNKLANLNIAFQNILN